MRPGRPHGPTPATPLSITAHRLARIAFGTLLLFGVPALAETPDSLQWEDLIPEARIPENPIKRLSPDQWTEFEEVFWVRTLDPQARQHVVPEILANAEIFEGKLRGEGVDIDTMIADYAAWNTTVKRRGSVLVDTLDGKPIRMLGYLLPLDFSPDGQNEFLLVPYMGACIHVPPPPPNQIVFVKTAKPFVVRDLYTPVWVTGRMSTKSSTKALYFVDGTADIDVGYALLVEDIQPYE